MSHYKRAKVARDNSQFIRRLSLERCRSYISHMQAVLHICDSRGEDVAEALCQIMQALDAELAHNLKALD